MLFLWLVGPVLVVVIYVLTASRDKRRAEEADAWAESQRVKRVMSVPSTVAHMFEDAGAGTPVRLFEIIPKIAYLGVFEANVGAGSDHQTVVVQLEEPAPTFTIRPLPVVDGSRITNVGVPFPKHRAFMEAFLVEGAKAAEIKRWLSRPLRKALLELPDVWVRVDGMGMAVTLYGSTYSPRPSKNDPSVGGAATSIYRAAHSRGMSTVGFCHLQKLVTTADALFAEYGAAGAPSLLLEDDREEDEHDEGHEEDEEQAPFHPPPGLEAATLAAARSKGARKADPSAESQPAEKVAGKANPQSPSAEKKAASAAPKASVPASKKIGLGAAAEAAGPKAAPKPPKS